MTREQILCIDEIRLPVIQEAAARSEHKISAKRRSFYRAALPYNIKSTQEALRHDTERIL